MMQRAWRLAAWLALALVLLVALWCALAWWVLPPWLKSRAEMALTEAFGRPAQIAAVRITPWPLAIEVDGIAVAARQAGRPPLLRIDRVHAIASAASVGQRALVLDSIAIERAQVTIERSARAQLDVDDLVQSWLAPAAGGDEPLPRIVVRRFDLRDSALVVDDRIAQRRQAIEALSLSVSGLTTRAEDAELPLQAKLALRLNGSAFEASGEARPWATTRRFDWRTTIEPLDLGAFRADLDALLPLRLQSARLSASVAGHYAQQGAAAATLDLHGEAALTDIGLHYTDGSTALQGRALRVQIGALRPLEHRVEIDRVSFDGAVLPLVRHANGSLNVDALAAPAAPSAATQMAPGTATQAAPGTAAPAWRVAVRELEWNDATIGFRDLGTSPATALTLAGLKLRAKDLRLPQATPMALSAEALLRAADGASAGRLSIEGSASPDSASIRMALDGFRVATLQPYLSRGLVPRIDSGSVHAHGRIDWADDAPEHLKLAFDTVKIDDLAVGEASWRSLAVNGLHLDLAARELRVAELRLDQPALRVARDARGQINLATWLRAAPAGAAAGAASRGGTAKPWHAQVERVVVDQGRLDLADAMPARAGAEGALALRIEGLGLRTGVLRWPFDPAATPVRLRGRFVLPADSAATPSVERRFALRGNLALAPLAWNGTAEIERAPLHLADRYVPLPPTQRLLGADASLHARLDLAQTPAGWRAAIDADASLADLRIAEQGGSNQDLMRWRLLAVEGLRLQIAPGERQRIVIRELQLNGVDGRLVVTEQGELDLATVSALANQPGPPSGSTKASANGLDQIDLEIGSTRLVDGAIDFEDHFIRPNYRAELTALNGQLGTVRSAGGEPAPLVLGGKVAGTGRLEISGSLNPTARPLALNLRARAADIELPPLSAYSGKYAGYGITEGTLSVDVSYRIDPDGALEAKNRIVLNRLTFGDPVESPSATKLPVRFLVALLKDRNGVIDINLPIQGSINEPTFRLGPLIVELLFKMLTRAVAAPFAAIAGEESDKLGAIGFEPGTAVFSPDAAKSLDRVATILDSRPALTLDIIGSADPASEADAFRQATLAEKLAALQNEAGAQPATGEQALRQLYRQSDLPDRPRNLIGRLADLPPAEMAARLRAAIAVSDDAMRDLALERGLAVRSALIGRGLASERLFVGTPALRGADEAGWSPRARLSLIAP